jgi:transcriptional regulator with XRE-family HTH domain
LEDVRRAFGKRLRALIKAREYKTAELFAHENGFSKAWIYRLLKGERDPALSSLVRLARSLDVTLDDLYPMKRKKYTK